MAAGLAAVPRGQGGLHPSEQNYAHCTSWDMLTVPKTGSSFASAVLSESNCCGRVQWRFHSHLYRPCSIATLREPCRRAVSSYAHLRTLYPRHWPGAAADVNEYVEALAQHWNLVAYHNPSETTGLKHHLTLAMPQHLWIGNASRVICNERLTQELPAVFRSVGCCHVPSSMSHAEQRHRVSVDTNKSWTLTRAQANMSAEMCALVRRLYWQDHILYRHVCLRG